jgi:hypothetical protein
MAFPRFPLSERGKIRSGVVMAFVTIYSGGSAMASHHLPYSSPMKPFTR